MTKRRFLISLLAGFALATAASAQFAPGEGGTLMGADRLRVPGCGRQAGPVRADVALDPNGAWSAVVGAATYTGTSTALTPRLRRLTFDAAGLAALKSGLETDASALCEQPVTLSALNADGALKLSKRGDRARLFLRARGMGSGTGGGMGTGLYRLRAGGAWITAT